MKKNVIILGAAGRDYHNYLVFFKNNPLYRVVAFTATQIPGIEKRSFPKALTGAKAIPIYPEEQLPRLVKQFKVEVIHLAYSDLSHQTVMEKASLANALGCDFLLLGPESTMLKSKKPVIAVTAVRTGCGKSQTTRYIAHTLRQRGKRVAAIRHPMPYGNLAKQAVQRFATHKDLNKHKTTIEEREEYEPLIDMGVVVYAGVDYGKILRKAEKEADIILWDGGNNDFPFYRPDVWITITDPHRPGHELTYYPGRINLLAADVILINKTKTAEKKNILAVEKNIKDHNPRAQVIKTQSHITADRPLKGKRVLVIEDGPTLTHGGMRYGAGSIATKLYHAKPVDPRPHLVGSLRQVFKQYPHLGKLLPAMGYSSVQVRELQTTINKTPCDLVLAGTPIDLKRIIKTNKPIVRVRYELREPGALATTLKRFTTPKR